MLNPMTADQPFHISNQLVEHRKAIAHNTRQLQFLLFPELVNKHTPEKEAQMLEDIQLVIQHLHEALKAYDKHLFTHFIHWINDVYSSRNIPTTELLESLNCLKNILRQELAAEEAAIAGLYLQEAVLILKHHIQQAQNDPIAASRMPNECRHYLHLLLQQNRTAAYGYIHQLLKQGIFLQDIYLHIFQPSQYAIGNMWQENTISVAQEHYCTAVTQQIMGSLLPHIFGTPKKGLSMLACCTSGELHELGLRMVTDFFELDGWNTTFLGANMPAEAIAETVRDHHYDLIAISTTMTFHLEKVRQTIQSIKASLHNKNTRILVGGNPFNSTSGLWKTVGADAFAGNAQEAIAVANLICTTPAHA